MFKLEHKLDWLQNNKGQKMKRNEMNVRTNERSNKPGEKRKNERIGDSKNIVALSV